MGWCKDETEVITGCQILALESSSEEIAGPSLQVQSPPPKNKSKLKVGVPAYLSKYVRG